MAERIARVIALGASNLVFGFGDLVALSRAAWGRDVEVLAALGHGRSYGAASRVAFRTLPGILECGLWPAAASLPWRPARAVITDIGNDIMYGCPAKRLLAWVDEAIERLKRSAAEITLTDLPLGAMRRVPPWKYRLLSTLFFPGCRVPQAQAFEAAERVGAGLAEIASARGIRLLRPPDAWYGFDPIHIRRSMRLAAWREILDVPAASGAEVSRREKIDLFLMPPERRAFFGVPQHRRQTGRALPGGGRVWLY
jgi:hypothetical protein